MPFGNSPAVPAPIEPVSNHSAHPDASTEPDQYIASVANALSAATCDHASAVSGRRSGMRPSANLVAVKHAQNVEVSAAAVETESPSRARATVNIHEPKVTSPATFNPM